MPLDLQHEKEEQGDGTQTPESHSYNDELLIKNYEDSISSPRNIYRRKQMTRKSKVLLDNIHLLTPEKKRPKRDSKHHELDSSLADKLHGRALRDAGKHHLERLARYFSTKFGLDQRWFELMMKFVTSVVRQVSLNCRAGDHMDILNYVKIKCIPGESREDSFYVDGVVFTNDRIHSKMPVNIFGPKILLLRNSITYETDSSALVSFDKIIRYEHEHLKAVTNKLAEPKPHMILVEGSVSHVARGLLYQKGITVIGNVKPRLMDVLSRISGSSIIHLPENSVNAQIGVCGRYFVKSFSGPWGKKTCTFFVGCPPDRYGSIILRGAPEHTLKLIKKSILHMIYCAYHMKLEMAFNIDQLATVKGVRISNDGLNYVNTEKSTAEDKNGYVNTSWSTYIPKKQKIKETEGETKSHQICHEVSKPPIYCELYIGVEKQGDDGEYRPVTNRKLAADSSYRSLLRQPEKKGLDPESPLVLEKKYSKKRSKVKELSDYLNKKRYRDEEHFSPQYILYLHSLFCTSTSTQCSSYELQMIHFYTRNDMTLGRFLEEFCFSSKLRCQYQECHRPINEHERSFMHNGARVHVVVKPFSIDKVELSMPVRNAHSIFTWIDCKDSKKPDLFMLPLSKDSWSMSFGQFLQQIFYDANCVCRYCHKSTYRNHSIFFYYNSMVTYFEYEPVKAMKISRPPMKIELNLKGDHEAILRQEFEDVKRLASSSYELVTNKLNELLESCNQHEIDEISETDNLLQNSKEDMSNYLELVYVEEELISLQETNIFRINSLRRSLYCNMRSWNKTISDLEAKIQKKVKTQRKGDTSLVNSSSNISNTPSSGNSIGDYKKLKYDDNSDENYKTGDSFGHLIIDDHDLDISIDSNLNYSDTSLMKDENKEKESGVASRVLAAFEGVLPHKKITVLDLIEEEKEIIFPQEHHNEPVVVIQEQNPASIITLGLTSERYEEKMRQFPYSIYKEKSLEDEIRGLVSGDNTNIDLEWRSTPIWGGSKHLVQCKIFFARQFAYLRKLLSIDEELFTQSLQKCKTWQTRGGKSRSSFCRTLDERFIIKQVQNIELEAFLQSAPLYFDYFSKVHYFQVPTALTKIIGIYSVSLQRRGRSPIKIDLIIQENLFYKQNVTKIYDLKGSLRSRYAKPTCPDDKEMVYLDENLLESIYADPICIDSASKSILGLSVWNDTLCLASLDVMDYSLLVGVDEKNGTLIVGIIDYMRTYTWDKQLETWVKRSGILGGNAKTKIPTIISPKQYKKRFRLAMWSYFLLIPYVGINIAYSTPKKETSSNSDVDN